MASVNKVILVGTLGKDPEIKTFQSGDKVANLSIATSEKWKDKATGERKERTEWHTVSLFGGVVGVVEKYLRKGSRVYLEGQLQTRKWQDKSGNDRFTTEVVVRGPGSSMVMLHNPHSKDEKKEESSGGWQGQAPKNTSYEDDYLDDIPF